MKPLQALDNIKKSIYDQGPTAEACLFGSRATGTHRRDSDWGVLILVDDSVVTHEIEDKFRDVLYDLELASSEIIFERGTEVFCSLQPRTLRWRKITMINYLWEMEEPVKYISINPNIRFGKPCIVGTRIAISDVLSWLASGMSHQEILSDFPALKEEHIQAALSFAAHREQMIKTIAFQV